jgi:hypothetical protein
MKDGPNFCKKGVRSDICFSLMLTPGKKLKEVIVYEYVSTKTSFGFAKFASSSPKQLPQNQG